MAISCSRASRTSGGGDSFEVRSMPSTCAPKGSSGVIRAPKFSTVATRDGSSGRLLDECVVNAKLLSSSSRHGG